MHQIVLGSIEVDGSWVTGGVHTGGLKDLRYVRADITTGQPGDTVLSLLSRTYDNSTGCLIKNSFKLNEGKDA